MKGLVKFGTGKKGMEIRELPEPEVGEGDLKVKVKAAGICGSDVHIMRDEIPVSTPVVIGHEYVGVVAEVGPGVTKFKPGDWITSMTTYKSCGECFYCHQGLIMYCAHRKNLGFTMNGAMADYLLTSEANSFLVPEAIENKLVVAACEPLGCGTRGAAERARIRVGDVVVVSGPGNLGLSVVQIAKLQGAYVIVFGLKKDERRLKLALELGADEITWDEEDLKRKVFAKNPYGADVAFEAAGAEASMDLCINITRKRGTLAQMGLFPGKALVDMNKILDNELTVSNNFGSHRSTWELCLRLLAEKKVSLDRYIETQFPLSGWEEAFEAAAAGTGLKVLLIPDA